MNGPDHYIKAERFAHEAEKYADADTGWRGRLSMPERIAWRDSDLAAAQVHATLAVADALAGLLVGSQSTPDVFNSAMPPVVKEWAQLLAGEQ